MINHALTGAVIGLAIGKPAVAVPLALASHFICDIIPHYDLQQPDRQKLKSRFFQNLLVIDILLCLSLVTILAVFQPLNWFLAAVCAFIAAAPDLAFLKIYLQGRRDQPITQGRIVIFTRRIQWFQRPIGWMVEVVWFVGAVLLLAPFLGS
jgi:hypothetical protein